MPSPNRNARVMAVAGMVVVFIMAGLIINYFNYQYQSLVAAERERLVVAADYLDTYLNTRLMGLNVIAAHPDVRSLEADRVRPDLLAAARALGAVNVALYDGQGDLISDCWSSAPGSGHSPFARAAFKQNIKAMLSESPYVSDRITYGGLESSYIGLQVPVLDGDQVVAVLAAFVPISDVSMAVLHAGTSDRQYIFVWDGSGQFVHHPRLSQFYPEPPELKAQVNSLLCNRTGTLNFNSALDGIEKLLIYTDVNAANWRVATAIPLTVVYTRVWSKSLEDAESFLLLALCFGLLYGIWRQAKRHEREREQLRLERMTCVNQLAAGIAHEIRNPLTSIKGFIQLMIRRGDRPASPEHLEIIIAEIGRIDNLISEFQMLAKPLKEPSFEKANICKMLSDILLLMEGQFRDKNITLDLKLPASGCFALGDIAQLKQVFINLIKNAVEAAPVGGSVTITVDRQQGMMAVAIQDNGPGIAQDKMDKLGTPFFTTKTSGNGLGLSVCYSIVQNHGGKILVSSQAGKQTIFTVLLPADEERRIDE